MRIIQTAILLLVLVLTVTSCRVIQTITGQDQNLKKVTELWSDVPRMDGLTSAEADMPLFVKLLMRTALNNLGRLNNQNEAQAKSTGDWAVFTTAKTPEDFKSFYTNDRMTTFGGWEASKNSTCLDGNEQGFSGVACVFKKEVNNMGIGLLIVAAQDQQKKQTTVFFVRVETDETSNANKPMNQPTNQKPKT